MSSHLDNEAALIRKAQAGDAESFCVLASHYEQRIYRLGFALATNAEDAEEVLLATFAKARTSIGQFQGEARFYTWLIRIAVNEALAKLGLPQARSRGRQEATGEEEPAPTPQDFGVWRENPEEDYSRRELNAVLSKGLFQLEVELRFVFVLRDVEGLSVEDTAQVLGLPVAVAKDRLLRARLKLREMLSAWFKSSSVLTAG